MAEQVAEIFTEVVVAPVVRRRRARGAGAQEEHPGAVAARDAGAGPSMRPISGGLLLQQRDALDAPGDDPAPGRWPPASRSPRALADLAFAWRACRAVKSNAILLAHDGATVGVGMGQVNRVDAAQPRRAAGRRPGAGSVAASDAFFPFPDGLEVLAEAGVRAVVQPGGSVRDDADDRRRERGRGDALLHRHPPLRALGAVRLALRHQPGQDQVQSGLEGRLVVDERSVVHRVGATGVGLLLQDAADGEPARGQHRHLRRARGSPGRRPGTASLWAMRCEIGLAGEGPGVQARAVAADQQGPPQAARVLAEPLPPVVVRAPAAAPQRAAPWRPRAMALEEVLLLAEVPVERRLLDAQPPRQRSRADGVEPDLVEQVQRLGDDGPAVESSRTLTIYQR